MILSLNEMRSRASAFAAAWKHETRERAEKDTFWNEFFAIFGISRRRVAVFEQLSTRHSTGGHGFMDVFWPGYLAAEHKSRGENLERAMRQALDYLPSLPDEHLPRLVVVSDFARFRVRDLEDGTEIEFPITDLAANLELFGLLFGHDKRLKRETEEVVNLRATALLADLHDALKDSGYENHALRVFMVRLLFTLFADDTQVWERGLFHDYITLRTSVDGSDLGPKIAHLFQILNTPNEDRPRTLDEDLGRFAYINGGLFAEALPIPSCNRAMRERLLACSKFDWSAISPAIFGSMFQNVMTPKERRSLGAHYTTEQNILKTICPLFVDDLAAELKAANSLPALRRYRDKLATLTFFDPACGCGNFLVIAYREIRRLELECLRRIRQREKSTHQLSIDVSIESKVHVGQFYGVEIEEFPVRIAETAMYLMDHLENLALSAEFGLYYVRFPIADTAHITCGNALRMDWANVLLPDSCTYLFGNPPFSGHAWMSPEQQQDKALVFTSAGVRVSRWGRLDYVACWYSKAMDYMDGTEIKAAFVSTNSITQGEQARSLGPALKQGGYSIDFAHRTFEWQSEAQGRAHVHVVIIGFSAIKTSRTSRRHPLYDYTNVRAEPAVSNVGHINWYLADGPDVFPDKRYAPLLDGLPIATKGSQPTDGGHLIISAEDLPAVRKDPIATKYVRPFMQTTEFLGGIPRWCLWLVDASPAELRSSPVLRQRMAGVRDERLKSPTASVRAQASIPALFTQRRQPCGPYLAMPEVSSETRRIIPAAFLPEEVIAGNKLITFPDADLWIFGLVQSAMFMAWVRTLAGRMKSDISIAPSLCYFTFPFPDRSAAREQRVVERAQAVLDTRQRYPGSSLGDLYSPLSTPPPLVGAHNALDRAVDSCFRRTRYSTDGERLGTLFERYVSLTAGSQVV